MLKKTEISLSSFFIFNPKYGPKEGEEHKKILYYYPPSTDLDTKIKKIGLCEAIVKFTETFSEKPCQSVHTQKYRQLFFEAEPGYWMVLIVTVPASQKLKDGQSYLEYHDEDLQDSVYEAVLLQCYRMFALFNGTISHILNKYDLLGLKQRFNHFYSKYLLTLKLGSCDSLEVFRGIHFLPLDKNSYLRIQCFINLMEATFPMIKYSVFLYQDQLVWSGLEQEDMRVLYTYLTTSLFPAYMEQEFQPTSPSSGSGSTSSAAAVAATPGSLHTHYGKFLLGPPRISDETNQGRIPRLFVSTETQPEECSLLVYKALGASVCLIVDGDETLNFTLFKRLDKFLGPQLSSLASDIGDVYVKKNAGPGEGQLKYVYFNHMNLAQKTSIHADLTKSTAASVSQDVVKLIADLNLDLSRSAVDEGETIIKTCSDCWVVSKKSDQRELYVILNQKNANLIEINEEVRRLCASHFNNIFFLE